MFGIVTHLNFFFVLFVFRTQALPITNHNNAMLVQSGVDNGKLLFEVNGGGVQNTRNAEDTATAADSSPDFRIDEAQLAEYTVHSQAEEGGGSSSSGGFRISLLPTQEKTAESVNLEQEGIPSKVLGTYDKTQKKVADLRNLEPIVDTISEHEKYGNNGDMFDGIARSIVNGYEAFSNLLNTLIQKPKDIARSISKGITAQLDIIGGKIVGL